MQKESITKYNTKLTEQLKHNSYLNNMITEGVLWDILSNNSDSAIEIASELPELCAEVYQVVIYEQFYSEAEDKNWSFADLLRVTNAGNNSFIHLSKDGHETVLLKGQMALTRFHDCLSHYNDKIPPQQGSLLDSVFLAYGRPVNNISELAISYNEAISLIKERFFCSDTQHTLGYQSLTTRTNKTMLLNSVSKLEYSKMIVGFLQTLHRKNVTETLTALKGTLTNSGNNPDDIRIFLFELYMQIREDLLVIYHNHTLSFMETYQAYNFFMNSHLLSELIGFITKQLEMVMRVTGNPARNNVMDDLIAYIDHNFSNNLKLENIAPFFGYNSAYLGKLFTKNMGQTFNTYIDHIRIEEAKKLLSQSSMKVYDIADKVGYQNVDYFHKKFRKYTGESPAEFRKKQIKKA